MKRKKSLVAGALGLGLMATMVAMGQASADPSGTPTYRELVGVGSDTTDNVMNGMANAITIGGNKVLGSFDANGGALDSRDPAALPATATTCHYNTNQPGVAAAPDVRPLGSGNGRSRLVESLTAGNARQGCLDFSRSSSLNLAAVDPSIGGLTYVPFALDGLSYAVRSDSTTNKQLSLATLKLIYQCDPATTTNFIPLLPQAGSGTRSFWLTTLGLTEATKGACIRDTWVDPSDGLTKPIEEHIGKVLLSKKEIIPMSAAQYAAQSIGVVTDNRGKAVLGGIGGVPAIGTNPGGAGVRKVYNVIPTNRIGNPAYADLNSVFVGPNSLICQQTAVIGTYGFGTIADCGSTTNQTP